MIKSNGNYLAVKVPEGAYDFGFMYDCLCYELEGKTKWINSIRSGEVIALLSSYNPIHRLVLLEDWDEMCDVPKEEYSQWLIIKKG